MAVEPLVVDRYARALFGRALKEGVLNELSAVVRELMPALRGISGLKAFFEAPQIPKSRKRALIDKTFAQSEASQLDEFALLLLDRGRMDHFQPCLERFLELEEEHRGVFPASVTTAVALDDGQRETMRAALQAHTGHTLDIVFQVEPRLIGGVVFRHRDEMLDSSLRSGLQSIRAGISQVRVH